MISNPSREKIQVLSAETTVPFAANKNDVEDDPQAIVQRGAGSLAAAGRSTDAWIKYGFYAAVLFALLGFVAVVAFFCYFAHDMTKAFSPNILAALSPLDQSRLDEILSVHIAMWRFALLACGMMGGVVLGFLGLALFLLGVNGDMNGKAEGRGYSLYWNHVAPGTLVIIAATVLIGVCALQPVRFKTETTDQGGATSNPILQGGGTSSRSVQQEVNTPSTECVPDPSIHKKCPSS